MKKIVTLLVALGFSLSMYAQEAKTLFVQMPDSLSPWLTAINRADCIDFLESKMRAQVENRFGRKSEMTALSSDYIHVRLAPEVDWQMKLLATGDSTRVICVVTTVYAPVCDSRVEFFTTDWKPVPASRFLTLPRLTDFLLPATNPEDSIVLDRAVASLDMLLLKADLSQADETLTFTLTTPEYVEKETAEKLKPFIRRTLPYVWQANRYSPIR